MDFLMPARASGRWERKWDTHVGTKLFTEELCRTVIGSTACLYIDRLRLHRRCMWMLIVRVRIRGWNRYEYVIRWRGIFASFCVTRIDSEDRIGRYASKQSWREKTHTSSENPFHISIFYSIISIIHIGLSSHQEASIQAFYWAVIFHSFIESQSSEDNQSPWCHQWNELHNETHRVRQWLG